MLATSTTTCRACASINQRCCFAAAHARRIGRHTACLCLHSVSFLAADSWSGGMGSAHTTPVKFWKGLKVFSGRRVTPSNGSPHSGTEVHQEHACGTSSPPAYLRSFRAYYWPSIMFMSIRLAPDGTQMEEHSLMWLDPNGFDRLAVSYMGDNRIVWMELQMEPEEFSITAGALDPPTQGPAPLSTDQSSKIDGIADTSYANGQFTITFRGSQAVDHIEPADDAAGCDPTDLWQYDSRIMMGVDAAGRLASIIISDPANSVAGWTDGG